MTYFLSYSILDWISETGIYEKFLPLYHMSNRPRSLNIFPSNEEKSRMQKEDLHVQGEENNKDRDSLSITLATLEF